MDIDEGALLRAQDRARHAEGLINDELLTEAFQALEATYLAAWRNTGMTPADTMVRERLFQAINLVGKVQEHLQRVLGGGKLARKQLEEIERRKELGVINPLAHPFA